MTVNNGNQNNAGGDTNQNGNQGGDDANQNQNQNGGANQNNDGSNQGDQGANSNNQNNQGGDVQLTEEQLAAAFKHPRFKELNEQAKKAAQLEKEKQAAEEKRLEEEGKYKELADKRASELEQTNQRIMTAEIKAAAAALGAVNPETVAKVIDRANISFDDSGNLQGVSEAVEALKQSDAYLFNNKQNPNLGNGTNPGNNNNGSPKVLRSQLEDPKFFRDPANAETIRQAMATPGGIIDDRAN